MEIWEIRQVQLKVLIVSLRFGPGLATPETPQRDNHDDAIDAV